MFFVFIFKPEGSIPDSDFSDLLFEVFVNNEISKGLNTSHEFWEKLEARNKSLARKLGYYEIEQIDNPCQIPVTVNPNEYFECFKSDETNKNIKD